MMKLLVAVVLVLEARMGAMMGNGDAPEGGVRVKNLKRLVSPELAGELSDAIERMHDDEDEIMQEDISRTMADG